ncbi:MAG: hypothetical protein ABEJ98_02240 [Candidatus Nanohaloarchaea archaeon]
MADEKLGTVETVKAVSGTVTDLKDFIEQKELSYEDLHKLLEAEKKGKNRKTARKLLEREIEKRDIGEKLETAEKDIEEIEQILDELDDIESLRDLGEPEHLEAEEVMSAVNGTVKQLKEYVNSHRLGEEQLEALEKAEKAYKNRKTAVDFLEDQIHHLKIGEEVSRAEEDAKELEKDLEKLEEADSAAEAIEKEQNAEDAESEESDEKEVEEADEGESGAEEEGGGESGDEKNEEDEDREDEDSEEDDAEAEKTEREELIEELDLEMSDEELEEVETQQLRQIRDERDRRQRLLQELSDQFDPEELENTSTSDMEKLASEMEEDDEEEKSDEEIKKEAREDLEMLKGAVKSDEEEEEDDSGTFDEIRQVKEAMSDILDRGGDEEAQENVFEESEVVEKLEEYRDLDSQEAAIKTAHIMKAYLEYSQNIDRELTYGELADELEGDEDYMQTLKDFFSTMNKDQYTGKIQHGDDMDEIIEAAQEAVKS